jgi:predicted AlkP superfamily phosphohydrolase/phosphomutase
MDACKLLLVELNEITWRWIDPLIREEKLPTFAWLKRAGTWGTPTSVDLPPQLDPWITWTTLYTGRRQADHNVFFLQQPPETIRAPRIWEICHQAGHSVGVYGSLCSWPPQPVRGFYVPDTFAPDAATYPESLQPIQRMNLTYTRSVRLPSDQDGLRFKLKLGADLLSLGLSPGTLAAVARQLARERLQPAARWRRVALQPRVNFDFFSRLYRRHRPDFASFHSNHVAHYMHTYWKAAQPEAFPLATPPEEARLYGGAIEYGYRTADALLQRFLNLMDDDTVLVVASSMGQQPYVSHLRKGKQIRQLRSLDRLLEILDVQRQARALATMSDEFNLYAESGETKDRIVAALGAAYVDSPERPMFTTAVLGDTIAVNLHGDDAISEESRCHFPHLGNGHSFRYGDLVYTTGAVKSGYHDPEGMLLLYGSRIRRGGQIQECNNLDIAPTLLTLLGLPAPKEMEGRVLREAFASATGRSDDAETRGPGSRVEGPRQRGKVVVARDA